MTDQQTVGPSSFGRKVFVIRCRRTPGASRWWCELHEVNSGESIAFADGETLLDYLRRQLVVEVSQQKPGLR